MRFKNQLRLGKEIIFSPETSCHWLDSDEKNDSLLRTIKLKAQAKFEMYGFLFINDILDMLGIKRTSYGQLAGWSRKCGDEVVELRIEKFYQSGRSLYKFNFDNCNDIWYLIGTSS